MKRRTINEINEYTSPDNFLVVGKDGKLHRINVPFKVRVLRGIPLKGELKSGQILEVGKVKTTRELKIIYIIHQKPYLHSNFEIL